MRNENLLDLEYLNRNGDSMHGPLALSGDPILDAHAASKRYIDTVLANLGVQVVRRDGSAPMLGPLVLSGGPTLPLHATSRAYVDALVAAGVAGLATVLYVDAQDVIERAYADALDAAQRIYIDNQDATLLPLAGGIMLGNLELWGAPVGNLDAATKLYVDTAIPPASPSTYDVSVAAAGADYTSIVTACATEPADAVIFVKSGTYTETANIVMKAGQQLIGENRESTIIDFGAANRQINGGGGTNILVRELTIQNSITNSSYVNMGGTHARVENCIFIGTVNAFAACYLDGWYSVIENCYFAGFTKVGANYCARVGDYGKVLDCMFLGNRNDIWLEDWSLAAGNTINNTTGVQVHCEAYTVLSGNVLAGPQEIEISGARVVITGNEIEGGTIQWDANQSDIIIVGNHIRSGGILCTYNGSYNCVISGNVFNAGLGIAFNGRNSTITGNTFAGTAWISLTANSLYNSVTGNNLEFSTAVPKLTDAGTANNIGSNMGLPITLEKKFFRMKNTSGGALVAGDTVVLKAVAAGDEVDTTVNQGDDVVFGMLEEGINNNAYGQVQTIGHTVRLKVNGVINIGIGDLLGTFTAAGISQQAQAGDMAFAIALEVYAGADSLGVIDALLITPRKV